MDELQRADQKEKERAYGACPKDFYEGILPNPPGLLEPLIHRELLQIIFGFYKLVGQGR